MTGYVRIALLMTASLVALSACDNAARDGSALGDALADSLAAIDSTHTPIADATGRAVAFLHGAGAFDSTLFADTMTLYIAPEGGGESRRVARHELADRNNWTVGTRSVLPGGGPRILTTKTGKHFNCQAYDLASRYPDLAHAPHVGAKLEPPGATSCLQSWNMTFVFSPEPTERRLITAVVYDQWEW